jgi:gamma-glutamylcyclotransferase (GGCT)/AIG2-like uncharacterized protein YtfP
MNTDLLFVYGSLLDSDNEFGQYLMNNSSFVSHAVFKGRLFDCGEYPGAVADVEGYKVKGSIYKLNNLTNDLTVLDDYEGFGIEQEQPNLFVRELRAVTVDNGLVKCWIYLYNLSVEGLTEITSGDYVSYLKA